MKRTLLIIMVVSFNACRPHPVRTAGVADPEPQTLCAVLSQRAELDGEEVVIEAVFQQTPHGMMLFSESCNDSFTHLEWQRAEYGSDDILRTKRELLKGKPHRRLSVIVRGVLRIAHRYECFGPNCLRQKVEGVELLLVEPESAP